MIKSIGKNSKILLSMASFVLISSVVIFVHVFTYDLADDNISEDELFEDFDLIEEAEAEEPEIEKDEDEGNADNGEIESVLEAESEEAKEVKEDVVDNKPKEPIRKQLPNSISKYGLIFYPPYQYKKDSLGRMICIHNDDKPSINNQDKPVHKDMECCLDPDEIPNPYCYYPREKYGKILDDFERKKEKMLRRHRKGKGL